MHFLFFFMPLLCRAGFPGTKGGNKVFLGESFGASSNAGGNGSDFDFVSVNSSAELRLRAFCDADSEFAGDDASR
jgi:hypothetical protein